MRADTFWWLSRMSDPGRIKSFEWESKDKEKKKESGTGLTVFGRPAPMLASGRQPKVPKETKASGSRFPRKKSDFLPVEKIVLLAERLRLTEEDEDDAFVCREKESCRVEKEAADPLPDLNIPIDLSSLSNDESDECCDGFLRSGMKKEPQSEFGEAERELGVAAHFTGPSASEQAEELSSVRFQQLAGREPRGAEPEGDLIYVYMSAVTEENNLLKYLRPCRACKETSCACAEVRPFESRSLGGNEDESVCRESKRKINKAIETDSTITGFECVECEWKRMSHSSVRKKDPREGNWGSCALCQRSFPGCLSCGCCETNLQKRQVESWRGRWVRCQSDSGIDSPKWDAPEDSATTCRELNSGENSARKLVYTSSLANAARSARILARDLETVLRTFER